MIRHIYAATLFVAMIVCCILKANPPNYAVVDIAEDDYSPYPCGLSSNNKIAWVDYPNSYGFEGHRWQAGTNGVEDLAISGPSDNLIFLGSIDDSGNVPMEYFSYQDGFDSSGSYAAYWPHDSTSATDLSFDKLADPGNSPGVSYWYAEADDVDYNGTIYGVAQTASVSDFDPGNPDETVAVTDGVSWSGGVRSELGDVYLELTYDSDDNPEIVQEGTYKQVIFARNNHTLGYVASSDGSEMSWTADGTNVDYFPIFINSAGDALGIDPDDFSHRVYYAAGGSDSAAGIGTFKDLNHATLWNGSSNVDCPQIIGTDTNSAPVVFQRDPVSGVLNTTYIVPSDTNYTSIVPGLINDAGAIEATAMYGGAKHVVLLLPCQFRLLNGSTNSADVDGMDFNGNRPTTISATSNYVDSTVIANDIGNTNSLGNDGIDVLGIDTPLGQGRPVLNVPFYGNSYIASIMMLARVESPAATNVTYAWYRDYQIRGVTIENTSTNTWYVKAVGYPSGIPTPNPDWTNSISGYQTTASSTNNNVVAIYDNPGMYISQYTNNGPNTNGPHINDYVYQKVKFTYYLTNSIGTASALATQNVGTYIVVQKTNNSGVIANDWSGKENIVSTTNIPDCSGVTTPEIRAIVGGTNAIILDSNVTNNF
jgi:hypothetical protein